MASVASAGVRLVVTTWNLQGSKGVDVDTVVGHVRSQGSDVLLLQEVQRAQARLIARALGDASLSWAFKHWPIKFPAEGMAIVGLSRPVEARAAALTRRFRWWNWRRRIMQVARLALPGPETTAAARLCLVNVHLSPHDTGTTIRAHEVSRIVGLIAGPPGRRDGPAGAAVVGGDFNDRPESALTAQLVTHDLRDAWLLANAGPGDIPDGATNWHGIARRKPANRRIDYVWVSAGVTVESAHVPTPDDPGWASFGRLSDHLPLTVTIDVEARTAVSRG